MSGSSPTVAVLRTAGDAAAIDDVLASVQALPPNASRVLLKPNLIKERHLLNEEYRHVITQPQVTGPVLDWVLRAYPNAELHLADAPQGDADMGLLLERSGVVAAVRTRSNASVTVQDLRLQRYEERHGVPTRRVQLTGDSLGSVRVNLGRRSCFFGHDGHRYYGADYDIDETNRHHRGETQEYMFSGTALQSDLVVNLPKLKTHKKAGITASLKNLVGLNADKNWLPHHSIGTPRNGGDAYPDDSVMHRLEGSVLNWLKPRALANPRVAALLRAGRLFGAGVVGTTQEVVRSGNWHGNDTIWRMILDLNRILLYARPDGSIADTPQRATLSVIDGILAGEGNGPEAPDPKAAGVVIVGTSFAAVDLVCARLMGFDWRRIPHLAHLFDASDLPLVDFTYDDILVTSDNPAWDKPLSAIATQDVMHFKPPFGWVDRIEALDAC